MDQELAVRIERCGDLKGDLLTFARGPRFERSLTAALLEVAGPEGELDEGDAIGVMDRFALQHRLPDGRTVLERFVASRPDLTEADREMLLAWRDPVEGIFEIRGRAGDAIILLNLLDDLEYRTYSNMGRAGFRSLPRHGFVQARLVPIHSCPGIWLVSGAMSAYRNSEAGRVAQAALELATMAPELVFRNPAKIEQGWEQMRRDRAAFVEFFGGDELVLAPAEAEEQINAFHRHRQDAALAGQPRRSRNVRRLDVPVLSLTEELAGFDTVGIIFDETDGLNFYADYGMLRDLFTDPALAADRRYAEVLREYLRSETISPLPLQRLAAAHPGTVDAVYRKVLRKPNFTWTEHGEALLLRRKPWYYESEPRPGVSVIGERLIELAARSR